MSKKHPYNPNKYAEYVIEDAIDSNGDAIPYDNVFNYEDSNINTWLLQEDSQETNKRFMFKNKCYKEENSRYDGRKKG